MNKDIIENINNAKKSKSLSIKDVQLTDEIWNEIIKLEHLEYLYIYGSVIFNIPDEFSNLQNFKSLSFQSCNLSELPLPVLKIESLIRLNLYGNYFSIIPDYFAKLKNLEDIELGANDLKELPKGLNNLKQIKDLDLRHYKIGILTTELFEYK